MTAHHFQSMNPIDALFLDLDGTLLDNSYFPESIVGTCGEIAAAQPGLDASDIARIADTYHSWRAAPTTNRPLDPGEGFGEGYADVPGFCKSADLEEVRRHGHVLSPGRYVGVEPQPDDGIPFEVKMAKLTTQWREQQAEAAELDAAIEANLRSLGFIEDPPKA